MSTYTSNQCPHCGQSTGGLSTTSFCPPAQSIRSEVEEPEVVLPLDGDNCSLSDSECSSLWIVTPMSCSTLSVSSEWESQGDSVEPEATGEKGKEVETDGHQKSSYLVISLTNPCSTISILRLDYYCYIMFFHFSEEVRTLSTLKSLMTATKLCQSTCTRKTLPNT